METEIMKNRDRDYLITNQFNFVQQSDFVIVATTVFYDVTDETWTAVICYYV